MKRITIRNLKSVRKRKPRVFDVLIDGEKVYLEVKTGKDESELIPISDVLEQIKAATIDKLNR